MGKSQHSNMKILIILFVLGLLLSQVAASPLPAPQRRRWGGRGRGRYGRPPPPRYGYGSNTSSSNYFNTVLPEGSRSGWRNWWVCTGASIGEIKQNKTYVYCKTHIINKMLVGSGACNLYCRYKYISHTSFLPVGFIRSVYESGL